MSLFPYDSVNFPTTLAPDILNFPATFHLSDNPPPGQGAAEQSLWAVCVRRALCGAGDPRGGDEEVQQQQGRGHRRRSAATRGASKV